MHLHTYVASRSSFKSYTNKFSRACITVSLVSIDVLSYKNQVLCKYCAVSNNKTLQLLHCALESHVRRDLSQRNT